MKHIHALSKQSAIPAMAQQSALAIKIDAFLDLMELGINKFPSLNFPRLPDIDLGGTGN